MASSIADFFDGFNKGWDTVGEVGSAFETNRLRRQARQGQESVEGGFTSAQGEELRNAAAQGLQVDWDPEAGAYTVGGQQTVAPQGRHTFLGNESQTAFTDDEMRGLTMDRIADVTERWRGVEAGEEVRQNALRSEAARVTVGEGRRKAKKSKEDDEREAAKRESMTALNGRIENAIRGVGAGDLGEAQALFEEYIGASPLNTDPDFPGYASFDPQTGNVTIVTNGFDEESGVPSTMQMGLLQWLGLVQDGADKSETGNPLESISAWVNGLNDEQKRRLDLRDKASAIRAREDLGAVRAFTAASNARGRRGSSGSRSSSRDKPPVSAWTQDSAKLMDRDAVLKAQFARAKDEGNDAEMERLVQVARAKYGGAEDAEMLQQLLRVGRGTPQELYELLAGDRPDGYTARLFQQLGIETPWLQVDQPAPVGDAPQEGAPRRTGLRTPREARAPSQQSRSARAQRAATQPLPWESPEETVARIVAQEQSLEAAEAANQSFLEREQARQLQRGRGLVLQR